MHPFIFVAWESSKVYIFWVGMHFFSSHMYPYFCADLSLLGIITSPFLVPAPHCRAIHWLQQTSTVAIQNMWLVLGTWIATQLVPNPSVIGLGTTDGTAQLA